MESQTIEAAGSTIEYRFREKANAPTVVFLHGLGANQVQFVYQCEFFSARYQVVTLNVRGHGNSRASGDFSLAACARDVISLLNALRIEQVHFVGNSMGGNIGYELLRSFEERLLSLTTFDTTGELNTPRRLTKMLTFTYTILPIRAIALLASSAGQTHESRRVIKAMMGEAKKETLLEAVPVLARFHYLRAISASRTPYMIIRGAKDSDINKVLSGTLVALAQRNNSSVVELDNAGHFANLDVPGRFNAILLNFLQGVSLGLDA